MTWIKNRHGGFHNAENTRYVGQTFKKFYRVWSKTEHGWKESGPSFHSANEAKAHAEAI